MNEFSILCRVLGTLYYRQPQDPLLVPLFTMIREGKLAQNWPLEQDDLLERLQKSCDMQQISTITTRCSWVKSAAFRRTVQPGRKGQRKQKFALFSERGMPLAIRQPTILVRCCWRRPGLKISWR
jgi:hypothetical protein